MLEIRRLSVAADALQEKLARRSIPALDGFRMIAVFTVVLYHAGYGTGFLSARHGVSGFFVLSGFLITWLLMKEYDAFGRVSLRGFYLRRSLRIFPAYYAFLAFSISIDLWRGNDAIKPVIWPGIFYLINYYNAINGYSSASIAHAWSLAVEEQFYLIWPLLFMLFIALQRKGQPWLIGGLCVIIVAVGIWRSLAYSVFDLGQSYVYNAFDTRFDNLAIGCLLAVLLRHREFVMLGAGLSASVFAPLITLALLYASRQITSTDYAYGPAFTIDAILMAVLIVQFIQLCDRPLWRWLNYRTVVYLGTLSYPLYLYHIWGLQIGRKAMPGQHELIQLAVGILAGIALAAFSYHAIERRFLRLKKRLDNRALRSTPYIDYGLSKFDDGNRDGANP